MDIDKQQIIKEYQEFVNLANALATKDIALYPLEKRQTLRDRFERHLIGMIEMYSLRYGDTRQRMIIMQYLRHQLFPKPNDKSVQLSIEVWDKLTKDIEEHDYIKSI